MGPTGDLLMPLFLQADLNVLSPPSHCLFDLVGLEGNKRASWKWTHSYTPEPGPSGLLRACPLHGEDQCQGQRRAACCFCSFGQDIFRGPLFPPQTPAPTSSREGGAVLWSLPCGKPLGGLPVAIKHILLESNVSLTRRE